jgi:hypothetical protein
VAETFGSLIDYIADQLQGFVTDAPMYATTKALLSPTGLSIALDIPDQSQPSGLVEIDNELIHFSSYDAGTGVATIPPWGRGQHGTTPANHLAGSRVSVRPKYPRSRIGLVVNQVIAGMCPPLHGIAVGGFDTEPLVYEYALPANTRNVLKAEWRYRGDVAVDWRPLRSATVKRDTGVPVLHIPACMDHEVRYTVATNPTPLVADADLFTATGLPESCIDIVSLGAIPRLVSTNELGRQQLASVESSERAALVPSGSGTAAARFYMQMYQDRLAAEVRRQRQEYPLTVRRNV